jgi:hypothetical protein
MKKGFIILFLVLLAVVHAAPEDETLLIRIAFSNKNEEARVKALGLKVLEEKPGEYIETRLPWEDVLKLNGQKFNLTYVIEIGGSPVDSAFHSFTEVRYKLARFQKDFPQIAMVRTLGETAVKKLPLLAVVLSDNPGEMGDRPAVLITGGHHAREPLSVEICLHLVAEICRNYQQEIRVTRWLKELEIWVVPVVNPDGYSLIFNANPQHQFWRKNLRDNNGNGYFDTEFDGVDLNRNYAFSWELGGSIDFCSPFFRGPEPFSENETRALKELVEQRQFALIIDFHSFGETVLYPWSNFNAPPDLELLTRLANDIAQQIQNSKNTGCYETLPLDAQMGQSSVWHYGQHGIPAFIIESGDTYFPPAAKFDLIVPQNTTALYYLFERLRGSRLSGHVRENESQKPLRAQVCLIDSHAKRLQPIYTEPCFGRFDRLVLPGIYSIEISASGFRPRNVSNIQIADSQTVELEIFLEPVEALKTQNEPTKF